MAHSLRRAAHEPAGSFADPGSGITFTVRSGAGGTWIRRERGSEAFDYPVSWVIGSGRHASGFLVEVNGHLFQAPLCYYPNRRAYGLAPGYENLPDPGFTRPVGEECVLCHSGRPLFVRGTANRYEPPVFAAEAISCERCHGPAGEHLRRPVAGSIVNPAKLPAAARDSVCEQCHLAGVARILNPGRDFADFRPGMPLESVFTVYVRAAGPGGRPFKVISHAEQLAQSACARNSRGRLWCGTCHDPHAAAPATPQTVAAVCQSCHEGKLAQSHPTGLDCVSCHMTRRQAQDGGHTVFTDHRITRRPADDDSEPPAADIAAWREPEPALQPRNLALACLSAGIAARSPAQIVRGYRMLTEVQRAAPDDIDVLRAIGRALLLGKEPAEALQAFTRVLELEPARAANEEDAGVACLEAGQTGCAASHLEQALHLDPLRLSASTALQEVYRKQGRSQRAGALADPLENAIRSLKTRR